MGQINNRIDDDLKNTAEIFPNELGLTFSSNYQLTKAELILRAKEMDKGVNTVVRELIED